jgi:hypothetical protein
MRLAFKKKDPGAFFSIPFEGKAFFSQTPVTDEFF